MHDDIRKEFDGSIGNARREIEILKRNENDSFWVAYKADFK